MKIIDNTTKKYKVTRENKDYLNRFAFSDARYFKDYGCVTIDELKEIVENELE